MGGLVFLICWIFGAIILREAVPIIFEGLFYLVRFLGLCLGEIFKLAGRVISWASPYAWRALGWAVRKMGTGAYCGLVFLFFVADEWLRGTRGEETAAYEFKAEQTVEQPEADTYESAAELLGLAPGFTREALKHAYRTAMRAAHPDAGGSVGAAQAVNGGYELLLQAHGWAR